MANIRKIPGLVRLLERTQGDECICVAVLDGAVDLTHPSLVAAKLTVHPVLGEGQATIGDSMSTHGTHVTSVIFGQKDTAVTGFAPQCRGVIIPVFSDRRARVSQLDLARGIEAALEAGAHLINISGGQQIEDDGEADEWLQRAVEQCRERNVLIIAAAGNNRCACLHAPAALTSVLAVGAMKDDGQPFKFSNYGGVLQEQGVLAPGENILGADPQGGVWKHKGTSCAAPIVTGVAALLLSLQRQQGRQPSAAEVRQAILDSALPCNPQEVNEPERCLRGKLNIAGATEIILAGGRTLTPSATAFPTAQPAAVSAERRVFASATNPASPHETAAPAPPAKVKPVYALGAIGYDFGSEARRDTFKQRMPSAANPYDPRQMAAYLAQHPDEARALTWTLNQEQTPLYAIKPVGSFGHESYETLRLLLAGEVEAAGSAYLIERVSLPGERTEERLQLFSGQQVPIIRLRTPRGLYGWQVKRLVEDAVAAAAPAANEAEAARLRRALRNFLNHIYHELKNPGLSSKERALNFAATNAFQAAEAFATALAEGRELKNLEVVKSPVCRLNSDCWDLKLKFFDPDHGARAKRVCRFTIDVSDALPVTLGALRTWLTRD